MTSPDPLPRFDAVLFDLLTALLDLWSLWNAVADSASVGRAWRGIPGAHLRRRRLLAL